MNGGFTPTALAGPISAWLASIHHSMYFSHAARRIALLWLAACVLAQLGGPTSARAVTDEIQVYDAEINNPGQFSVEFHNNFTPIGHNQPDFPGGIASNHTLNGVPEWAYGVTNWFELGVYAPIYSITGESRFTFDGVKLRALFVVPHAAEKKFFYGVNFELGYNSRWWDPSRFGGEVRFICGYRIGQVDLIFNPIFDTTFNGIASLDFVPAERVAYNFSAKWAAALEHYSDYGPLKRFLPLSEQDHTLFAAIDYKGEPNSIEFGVGHGFTSAGDCLVFKLMVTHNF